RLLNAPANKETGKKAADLLYNGDLDGAAAQLDQLLRQGPQSVEQNAANNFTRALAYGLQFQSSKAFDLYQKAYSGRPGDAQFGFAYAAALEQQDQLDKSVEIAELAVKNLRAAKAADQSLHQLSSHQFDLAVSLDKLASLYMKTERMT